MSLALSAEDSFALTPEQILIVVSSSGPEGTRIANEYCAKRRVPESQIAVFPMLRSETISRNAYDSYIADPLRKFIEDTPGLKSRIRCLLTVYGVPLRIGKYTPTSEEKRVVVSLSERLEAKQSVLRKKIRELQKLAENVGASAPPAVAKLDGEALSTERLPSELRTVRSFLDAVSKRVARLGESELRNDAEKELDAIRSFLLGETAGRDTDDSSGEQNERAQGNGRGQSDTNIPSGKHLGTRIGTEEREKLYAAREADGGLLVLCEQMLTDIARIEKRDSIASVDSELSLLYWRDYDLRRWLPNLLNPTFSSRLKRPFPPPTLMVARLDGPTPELASDLVDRAIRAEEQGLDGKFYIDSSSAKRKQGKMYKAYDESLEKLAEDVRANTKVDVVVDESHAVFPEDSCPDAALYCGWYSPRKYVDAFTWAPGAVGFHISSFAAQRLHNKDSQNWCKRMIEEGVAATLGPVSEPYLHSFPPPDNFFRVLLSGKVSLVETYYLTKPFNSWRMVLIGDPLYTPFRYHSVMPERTVRDGTPAQAADN